MTVPMRLIPAWQIPVHSALRRAGIWNASPEPRTMEEIQQGGRTDAFPGHPARAAAA